MIFTRLHDFTGLQDKTGVKPVIKNRIIVSIPGIARYFVILSIFKFMQSFPPLFL
jgi:hypothetical protein